MNYPTLFKKRIKPNRGDKKINWRGKEICWACGRLIPIYEHKEVSALGKTVSEMRFRKHISPGLKLFKIGGLFSGDVWCIKSNTFAR